MGAILITLVIIILFFIVIEGVLARGDRRLSKAILYVYEHGGFFDAWSEFFDYSKWIEAFEACGIDTDFYTMRNRSGLT